MRHYATLFDSAYLAKGLALHGSLVKHSSARLTLHILPMDDACEWTLRAMELPNVKILDRRTFESVTGLKELQASRTRQEYFWTCGSNLVEYLLSFGHSEITYLDADLFFFSDPEPAFAEIGERSIAITPHRLIPSKKHLEVNGLFNVGWVTFRDTDAGWDCASTWARQCRERCSASVGCGDQLYLDAWPQKYGPELCELGIGVNVAPWNVGQWNVGVLSHEKHGSFPCVDGVPIVCYHFHEYLHNERFTNYDLRQSDRDLIYRPYVYEIGRATERISRVAMQLQAERA